MYIVDYLEIFTNPIWIQCIKEFKNNPSVKGFMVEKACLASIYKNGLMASAINFKFDNYKFFTCIEEIDFSMCPFEISSQPFDPVHIQIYSDSVRVY